MLITKFLIVQVKKYTFKLYSNSIFKEKQKHFKEKHTTLSCVFFFKMFLLFLLKIEFEYNLKV